MRAWLRTGTNRWAVQGWLCGLLGAACQALSLVSFYDTPWYAALVCVVATGVCIGIQAYFTGRGHGLRVGGAIANKVWEQQILQSPLPVGEVYTQLVTHRDRSN